MRVVLDVVVVGSGPAGLTLARRFAAAGANFQVIERNADVGGIWDIDAPGSPMYESAHFISSRDKSGFPGFPMPATFPPYPKHNQILAYIRSFADAYALRQHIRFNTAVEQARLEDGLWRIDLDNGESCRSRYLVCANGVTWNASDVSWPGTFNGEIRHSQTFRSAREFDGRRVLIVGAGNSGVDIACDASTAASQAFLSVRRGYHFVPKFVMGKPSDVFASEGPKLPHWLETKIFAGLLWFINGDLTRFGLPKPDHAFLESHPLMNTQILHYLGHGDCIAKPDVQSLDGDEVVFVDGSRETVDLIITATGYEHSSPYLDAEFLNYKGGRPDLYLGMFPRQQRNLAVLGFVEFASAAYENFDRMAELIVTDVMTPAGTETRRELDRMVQEHTPDLKNGHRYVDSARHANYIEADSYLGLLDSVRSKIGLSTPVDAPLPTAAPVKGEEAA